MKKSIQLVLCMSMLSMALCACSAAPSTSADTTSSQNEISAADLIRTISTTQYFTDEEVNSADVEKILYAGVNAPSAMNGQKWHFTAISDKAVLEEIAGSMGMPGGAPPADMKLPDGAAPADMKLPDGASPTDMKAPNGTPPTDAKAPDGAQAPAAPAASTKAGLTDAPLAIVISCADGSEFDAALACQNMSAEAQLLGYGSKIISSATMALNGANKAEFDELLDIPEGYSAVAVLLVGKEDTSIDETMDGYTGATSRNPFDDMVSYVKPNA